MKVDVLIYISLKHTKPQKHENPYRNKYQLGHKQNGNLINGM